MVSMTRCGLMCLGSGICTRMPWIAGSSLSARMRASSSASPKLASYFSSTECSPVSAQALTLLRTYTADAGSSPTRMTARPGWMPRAARAAARAATSVRICCDRAVPLISWAGMERVSKTKKAAGWQRPWREWRGSGLGGGVGAERDLQQIGHGVGVQLFHDVGAVRLDRLDADAQVVGDLLVQAAGDDALEHLRLTRGQLGQQRVAAGRALVLGKGALGVFEHALDQAHQLVFLERLLDEIHGALLHGVHGHRHVAVAGDEDDGQGRLALQQAVLQFQAGHAAHADVHDQAGDFARVVARQEGFGGVEAPHAIVLALEQPLQRIAHGLVVVHDVDGAFLGNQAHTVPPASLLAMLFVAPETGIQKENRHPATSVPL